MWLACFSQGVAASELSWGDCPFEVDQRIRCGTLEVPENRDAGPGSRQITLSFARISAAGGAGDAAPMAFLTGGPGFSAFASLAGLPSAPAGIDRDIIVLEPRGYGYSDPWLTCDSIAEMSDCQARFRAAGTDVEQYTTAASVEDYEDLRRALGIDRWHLFGVSYGTYWASLYSRMHPRSILSIVMDSPYPLNAGYDWNREAVLNGFEKVFTACRADRACNERYPDLRQRFIETFRRLKAQAAEHEGMTIDHISAFQPPFSTLYIATSLKRTPAIVDALAREDYTEFLRMAQIPPFDFPQGFDYARVRAIGLNASVMCMEDIFFTAGEETRVALTAPWPRDIIELVTPEGWDYDQRCGNWPVSKADPEINQPVANDIPR